MNLHVEARTGVKEAVETRRNMRHARRFRKTPYRQNRENRSRGSLPPSTRRQVAVEASSGSVAGANVSDRSVRCRGHRRRDEERSATVEQVVQSSSINGKEFTC
jgi:hypothetical protein